MSDTLSLEEVVDAVGAPTRRSHSKGEIRERYNKPWKETLWGRESTSSSEWLEDHIEELVSWLESRVADYAKIRSACFADLFCLVTTIGGQAGVVIHRDLMPRLVALGLSVVLDIHDGGEPEEQPEESKPTAVN